MDNNLDMVLADIGRSIEWPEPSATFSQRVMARIETPAPRPLFRRAAPALGAIGVLVVTVLTFSPTTRDAVADFIGIGGVHIKAVPKGHLPTVPPGSALDLGRAVTLEEARAAVSYPVLVPLLPGPPDRVFLEKIAPADMVSLVYESGADATEGEIEFLITQFEGLLVRDGGLVKKMMSAGTIVERVEVNGAEGYWLSGDPHTFYYRDGDLVRDESVRLVENVLLWVQDGVTIRIETGRSLSRALEIAASLR